MATLQIVQTRNQNPETLRDSSAIENPRKAATKVKQANYNLDMMKRRLMVLRCQEDYNRYKTLDHEKRIVRHVDIHQKIVKDREKLRKSLQKINDMSETKEKVIQIRGELKSRVSEARKSLMEERVDRTHEINSQSIENEVKAKEEQLRYQQENKERKKTIKEQELQIRDAIIKNLQEKVARIKFNKVMDSQVLAQKAKLGEEEISQLANYEQELIKKNSVSLQASQVMRKRYNEVFAVSSGNSSHFLPSIRARTNNSKYSNNTTEIPTV